MTAEKIIYEYCVLRYVADVEREEFVNVGLMMMSKRYRWMRCEIMINEEKIKMMFRKPDIECLKRQIALFLRNDVPGKDLPVEERYRWMVAVKSAIIQTSSSHPGIIFVSDTVSRQTASEMLENKFNQLFEKLVE